MKYRFCSEIQWMANKCFLIKQRRKERKGRERGKGEEVENGESSVLQQVGGRDPSERWGRV